VKPNIPHHTEVSEMEYVDVLMCIAFFVPDLNFILLLRRDVT
jgi:hypothetical protein